MNLRKPIEFETTFAIYTATDIVGEGGSGRIFKATDESGETWAIKLLDHSNTSKEKAKRFKNEVFFCLRNQHPNIVTVVDHGLLHINDKSVPFCVMPLYDGSLRNLMKSGISAAKVLPYFSQILDGVEAAHLKNVIHRDLKPENILYNSREDRLLIADFGIAHFEEDDLLTAVETKDTTRLANFQYAAPEQRVPGSGSDYRTDIFALGLMLNEMFTAAIPFSPGFKTIGSVAPEYEYVDALVEEMLRQTPNERPPTIEVIKRQLIGRKNEFINRQRLSELENTVIPVSEIDDPIIIDPPRLIDFDWNDGMLTLILSRPVNAKWAWALQNMGGHSSLGGHGPDHFTISEDRARISVSHNHVQDIIDYFKQWLPRVNQVYEDRIRRDIREDEEKNRKELEAQRALQEVRQRVLRDVKI